MKGATCVLASVDDYPRRTRDAYGFEATALFICGVALLSCVPWWCCSCCFRRGNDPGRKIWLGAVVGFVVAVVMGLVLAVVMIAGSPAINAHTE